MQTEINSEKLFGYIISAFVLTVFVIVFLVQANK